MVIINETMLISLLLQFKQNKNMISDVFYLYIAVAISKTMTCTLSDSSNVTIDHPSLPLLLGVSLKMELKSNRVNAQINFWHSDSVVHLTGCKTCVHVLNMWTLQQVPMHHQQKKKEKKKKKLIWPHIKMNMMPSLYLAWQQLDIATTLSHATSTCQNNNQICAMEDIFTMHKISYQTSWKWQSLLALRRIIGNHKSGNIIISQ